MSQLYASTSSSIAPRRSTRQPVPVSHGASSASLNDAIAAGMSSKPNAANAGQQARSRVFVAHPLTRKTEPLPPFHPVHHGQARATTYPSRLRLGTTSLLQPLGQNGQVAGGGGASAASAIIAKRTRGTAINYAELETLDDPAPSPDSDDDGQTTARGRRLAAKRKQEAAANAAATPPPEKKAPAGGGRSFLGQVVPPNLIHVEQARKTRHQYASEEQLELHAEEKAMLVPIRIELDTETHRIRDCFLWNVNEHEIQPYDFAGVFCTDIGLPELNPYREKIAQMIREQIDEASAVAEVDVIPPELEAEHVEADLRVILNIDVQIGTLHLLDSVEWDLSSSLTPEHFSRQLCRDLGISGEAQPIIAHAVTEELLRHKRDALEAGLVGRPTAPISDAADAPTVSQLMNARGPRKMEGVWRDFGDAATFGPRVEVLSADDLLDREVDKERATKRARRAAVAPPTRSGGRSTRRQ